TGSGGDGAARQTARALKRGPRGASERLMSLEVVVEDGHLEGIGQFIVLVVAEQDTHELIADIDLRRIILLGTLANDDGIQAEGRPQILLQFYNLVTVHQQSPCAPRCRVGVLAPRWRMG